MCRKINNKTKGNIAFENECDRNLCTVQSSQKCSEASLCSPQTHRCGTVWLVSSLISWMWRVKSQCLSSLSSIVANCAALTVTHRKGCALTGLSLNSGVEGICESEYTKCKGATEHEGNSTLYFTRPAMIFVRK